MAVALAGVTEGRVRRGWALFALYPLLALFLVVFVLYPLLELFARAVIVNGRYSPGVIERVLADRFTWRVLWNTFVLGAVVAVLGTVLATAYAYAMTRVAIPTKGLWHFFAVLPTISPPILMALGLIMLYGRRGIITNGVFGLQSTALYGFWGLVLAQVTSYFPFSYLLMANLFRGVDASLEEAASTMGARPRRVLSTVTLPLLVPGLAASGLLMFSYSLADLGNPLLLGGDFPVMSSQIYLSIIGMYDVPQGATLSLILLAPALLMFFAQKRLAERTAFATVGGRSSSRHRLAETRAAQIGALAFVGTATALIVLQYATVLAGAVTQLFGINNTLTLRHFVTIATKFRGVLIDTVVLGVAASALSVAAGVLLAYFVARSRLAGRHMLDLLANLPLAIPGTVIGLSFAFAFNHQPLLLTGTAAIIVAAFVVRSLPYGLRSGVAAIGQLHRSLDEAAMSMGSTPGQTLWRIIVPLIRPALLAGMIFAFTRSITTLSAVIFVISPHWTLITPTILSQMDRGDVGQAAALSVVVVLLALLVIYGVPQLFGKDWREAQ